MELSEMKSNLKMNDLYFSSCSVERECKVKNGECKADLQRNITKTGEHQYDVELKLIVKKSDLSVSIVARAHFEYEADKYELEESIIKSNTVAIMFPFIRSQVTLLTTQPGMAPIVLPPINTTKFN
ncbi:MAG: protein-export chaperone SecB [Bacteroides sp.]